MDFYHILNRGVDKRKVFLNDSDRLRFVHDLFVMNDINAVAHPKERRSDRELLVNIHAWCLMDNHYHLLLSPVDDDLDNLSLFMKKINMGYAKFFNEKYERSGALWQGKYKKILIERDAHFMYIPYYIHLNPLDYKFPKWREGSVKNTNAALEDLKDYRWSSFYDYQGISNFPSIINQKNLGPVLGTPKEQTLEIKRIIANADLASEAAFIE